MDLRAPLLLIGAVLAGCTCDDDFDIPRPSEPEGQVATPVSDPRVPPGFGLAFPEGAMVRYGESGPGRATVLVTLVSSPDEVIAEARRAFEARGWSVRVRMSERSRPPARWREVLDALDGSQPVASASVERGVAEVTRLHLSERRSDAEAFHSPAEPSEWREVSRAPLPAFPGEGEPACIEAMATLCGVLDEAGGADAIDCAMDHRNACVRFTELASIERAVHDARLRLEDAWTAYDSVGSVGARAETLAQLHIELLLAKANLARAAAVEHVAVELAVLVAMSEAEGVTIDVDVSRWFDPDPGREIAPQAPP